MALASISGLSSAKNKGSICLCIVIRCLHGQHDSKPPNILCKKVSQAFVTTNVFVLSLDVLSHNTKIPNPDDRQFKVLSLCS